LKKWVPRKRCLKLGVRPSADDVDRDAGGVGADDGGWRARLLDARHQRLLGAGALDDHLDDPVALLDGGVEVIFQVADADQVGRALGEEVGGLALTMRS
jgi:hypothetical protein